MFTLQELLIHSEHKSMRGSQGHTNLFLYFFIYFFLPSVMKAASRCHFEKRPTVKVANLSFLLALLFILVTAFSFSHVPGTVCKSPRDTERFAPVSTCTRKLGLVRGVRGEPLPQPPAGAETCAEKNGHPEMFLQPFGFPLLVFIVCLRGAQPCTINPVSDRQTLLRLLFCCRLPPGRPCALLLHMLPSLPNGLVTVQMFSSV